MTPSHSSSLRTLGARLLWLVALSITSLCGAAVSDKEAIQPEETLARADAGLAHAQKAMAVTGHPLATEAALEILRSGGTALDAAIAAQMTLNVVEPQSSGIGGGAFLLYYEKKTGRVYAYDGREVAPQGIDSNAFLDASGAPKSYLDALVGGVSVGVPGLLHMLDMAHQAHGVLPWNRLFEHAIGTADRGFPLSSRLHRIVSAFPHVKESPDLRESYFNTDGNPKQPNTRITNKELASTLRLIARDGITPFYSGAIGQDIVDAVRNASDNPGSLSMDDLKGYRAETRRPLTMEYNDHRLVSLPPPSGGLVVLEVFGILKHLDGATSPHGSVEQVARITNAESVAYADRDFYLCDPDFIDVPIDQLLNSDYHKVRAEAIEGQSHPITPVPPGQFAAEPLSTAPPINMELPCTSHISIVDGEGNALSMTSSIEFMFGSGITVRGFILNNQLTDFSFLPEKEGQRVANRIQPGKRPRSAMSPLFVFDKAGKRLKIITGSPGGARIINYVVKALHAMIDHSFAAHAAASAPNYGIRNGPIELEEDTPIAELAPALRKKGYQVVVRNLNSGLGTIVITDDGLSGAADPRREGLAAGD